MADVPYTMATVITPGTNVARGRGYRIACSAAGYFTLILPDGSLYPVYATPGQGGEDNISIIGVSTATTYAPAGVGFVTSLTGRAV